MALPVARLPEIRPMLTVPGPLPADGEDAGWGFEVKWDGVRCVVSTAGDGTVRLMSRAGNDVTATYPELLELGAQLQGRSAVLDGELVALDERGRPDFGLLQRRMGIANPRRAAHLAMEYPVHLMIFDVMHLSGRSLLGATYGERRAILYGMGLTGRSWSVPTHLEGHARRAWDATLRHGYEGVIAKRLASLYLPGVRSPDWRKVKHLLTLDVVIGGWTEGRGVIAGLPGAVLAGVEEPSGLRYVGSVGSGLSGQERRDLARYLEAMARDGSPFAGPVDATGVHWVEPRLVAEITLTGWTPAGHLRHPIWHRLRPDLTRPG
ncbi:MULTISPECIES: non-homologous end-joining DNA ligase [Streptomyces]|uniref:non-homologous end-joining DNA ligase n=1 Tax=Streptomyces TaxID=1883 RepID=UPI00163C0E3B|nr:MULTISPECIES: non-homologous end-joining DNA ligase [Streptomyces]MBC2878746.1 ATP-dependent DNA ligase [Streptomyces sp. TYQ1024]UBI35188.1 non-homologous end-joining DNA ligase [Streptomyces mobaraensis]UKW27780.1 non-homologous end-joining DNA ligase [Streptomyces sp. TYQ1024]